MAAESCLYAAMCAPREVHDRLLRELVAPVSRAIRDDARLASLFFVRYNLPEWQLRFRVLGEPEWVQGTIRERVAAAIAPFVDDGTITGVEYGEYEREYERYGGVEGMALAETLFRHDSLACLDLLDVEAAGALRRSRREWSLLFTEALLDALGLGVDARLAAHRAGFQWALDDGLWTNDDLARLEARYAANRAALTALLGERSLDPTTHWGGEAAAAVAARALDAMRPALASVRASHAAGRIVQELPYLAWSYTHMHYNRMGIDVVPEAVLRFMAHRFHEEHCA